MYQRLWIVYHKRYICQIMKNRKRVFDLCQTPFDYLYYDFHYITPKTFFHPGFHIFFFLAFVFRKCNTRKQHSLLSSCISMGIEAVIFLNNIFRILLTEQADILNSCKPLTFFCKFCIIYKHDLLPFYREKEFPRTFEISVSY